MVSAAGPSRMVNVGRTRCFASSSFSEKRTVKRGTRAYGYS